MAKYTVELGTIAKSGAKIFDFSYIFYDDTKKEDFEKLFVDHFYFREIGVETFGRFQHNLKNKCNETLPYYNVLLKTALYEYDVKNNYNLTETFTKTATNVKDISGNAVVDGSKNDVLTNDLTTKRDTINVATGEKTNTLDSITDHTDDTDVTKNDTLTETGLLNNTSTVDTDNKKVESTTPTGLLSMSDIVANVYASKAEIDDNKAVTVDAQTTSASKVDILTEDTNRVTKDTIDATSHDSTTDTIDENVTEKNTGTATNDETFGSTTDTTQNETGNATESYTLERIGDIGVDTTPDKLRKHIEIQKILTTAYLQFFNECEDLFMQIF